VLHLSMINCRAVVRKFSSWLKYKILCNTFFNRSNRIYVESKVFISFFNLSYFNTKTQHYIIFYVSFSVKCGFSVLADKTRTMRVIFMDTQCHPLSFPRFFVRNFTPRKSNSYHNIRRRFCFIYILITRAICSWPLVTERTRSIIYPSSIWP
jgi:hypothetical protein